MIIINADDWGRSVGETDAALSCYRRGRVTSASAMVFMKDSTRSAQLARDAGIDVGLHLNFSERFSAEWVAEPLREYHERIVHFLTRHKYSFLIYNPALRREFRYVYQGQVEEFFRLYGRLPSHIDGHQHKHLCMNVLLDQIIPRGEKVRRNFFFWPEEKNRVNRTYRWFSDALLANRYHTTDFFFALSQCHRNDRFTRVVELAKTRTVELMAHPGNGAEYARLVSDEFLSCLAELEKGTYSLI